jgi:hypothetical protein
LLAPRSRNRSAEHSRCNVSRTGQVTVTLAFRALAPRHMGQVIDDPEPGPFR